MTRKYIEAGTVSLCDQQDVEDGTVSICDRVKEEDGTVVFCADEEEPVVTPIDPCADQATVVLSGPGDPDEGASYSVTGGRPPYSWSISAGTISDNGVVTSLAGACGSGTVTVSDSCGSSQQMEVRFPDGQWVLQSSTPGPCGEVSGLSCNPGSVVCSPTINGGTKTTNYVASGDWAACISGLDCSACVWINHIDEIECGGSTIQKPGVSACGNNASVWVLSKTEIHIWSCP